MRPDLIHMTLKFLGDIHTAQVTEAADILKRCCSDLQPFRMPVRGVGAFPSLKRPRVIFASSIVPQELIEAQAKMEEEFIALDIEPEKRPFRPHLTIGRVRGRKRIEGLLEKLPEMTDIDFGVSRVRDVRLMMSKLSSAGPEYTPLHKVALE